MFPLTKVACEAQLIIYPFKYSLTPTVRNKTAFWNFISLGRIKKSYYNFRYLKGYILKATSETSIFFKSNSTSDDTFFNCNQIIKYKSHKNPLLQYPCFIENVLSILGTR